MSNTRAYGDEGPFSSTSCHHGFADFAIPM